MLVPLAQELRAEGLEQVLPMVLEGIHNLARCVF